MKRLFSSFTQVALVLHATSPAFERALPFNQPAGTTVWAFLCCPDNQKHAFTTPNLDSFPKKKLQLLFK